MTYLQLVNEVLIRLREPEVLSVNENAYSKLIGRFVNDMKRKVEDACEWNCLRDTLSITTVPNIYNYALTGAGIRLKVVDVINDTSDMPVLLANTEWFNTQFLTNYTTGIPLYYNFNGVNASNDTLVDMYPVPDAAYVVNFNIIKPQPALSLDTDSMKVPAEPVILGAYAKAIAERGEDGGFLSSEAYQLHLQSLADHVSTEVARNDIDTIWNAI